MQTGVQKISLIYTAQKHFFHLVNTSALPILTAASVFFFLISQILYLHRYNILIQNELFHFGVLSLCLTLLN